METEMPSEEQDQMLAVVRAASNDCPPRDGESTEDYITRVALKAARLWGDIQYERGWDECHNSRGVSVIRAARRQREVPDAD